MVGYMPQRDLLLPGNVLDNVIIPLEIQGFNKSESRQQALQMLPHFGLENLRTNILPPSPGACASGLPAAHLAHRRSTLLWMNHSAHWMP